MSSGLAASTARRRKKPETGGGAIRRLHFSAHIAPQPAPGCIRKISMSLTYSLAPTAYSCKFRHSVILLDVAGDRYLRLAGVQFDLYREIALGTSSGSRSSCFAARLISEGIISEGAYGRPLITSDHEQTEHSSEGINLLGRDPIKVAEVGRFIRSLNTARRLRRQAHLRTQIELAVRWKSESAPVMPATIAATAAKFQSIAPFFFSTHNACLLRSLALLNYLFRSGVSADWVFGVRDTPFAAHCWIEAGPIVLNDEPDHVASYRRILTI